MSEIQDLRGHIDDQLWDPRAPREEVSMLLKVPPGTRKHLKILAINRGITVNALVEELMYAGYEPLMRKWEQEEES